MDFARKSDALGFMVFTSVEIILIHSELLVKRFVACTLSIRSFLAKIVLSIWFF